MQYIDNPLAASDPDKSILNQSIEVTAYKRAQDDDRLIKKGQIGTLVFKMEELSRGKFFTFKSDVPGHYNGEFMDFANSIQYRVIS